MRQSHTVVRITGDNVTETVQERVVVQGGLDACYQSRNALQRDSILAGFRMHQVRYAVRPVFESRTV